jgi:hypothetical protein
MERNIKLIRYLAAFCILFILGSDGALGRGLARISGSVTDATGAAVPGATVVATRLATGEKNTVISNGEGGYVLPPPSGIPLIKQFRRLTKLSFHVVGEQFKITGRAGYEFRPGLHVLRSQSGNQ